MINAFTIDVEDGISLAMRDSFNQDIPQTRRVVDDTERILNLLQVNDTKGTFFVLGQVAEVFPELVRKIADEGHELGVHGYNHLLFSKMDYKLAFQELERAKKLIEDISGLEVLGHRAPAFSINPKTSWGLDVVAEVGFEYDSSIMPCKGPLYGWEGYGKDIRIHWTEKNNSLTEVPLSVANVMGREIPVLGGSYLRLFPYSFTASILEKTQKERPGIVYIHPYEVDPKRYPDFYFKELKKASLRTNLAKRSAWINRSTVLPKLDRLLKNYRFDMLKNIINS